MEEKGETRFVSTRCGRSGERRKKKSSDQKLLLLFPSLRSPQRRGSDVVIRLKMEEKLDIMFHHGGDFKKNAEGIMIYSPDNKACLGDLDTDTLDVFYIRNYHRELGYNDIKQCWWHVPGKCLEKGLRNVNSDKDIRDMVNCARTNEGLIDIYFEHTVSVPEVLEGDNTVVYLDDHGGEGCNAGTDTDVSPPVTETHAIIVAPPIPKVVPNTSCKSSKKKNRTSPRQSQPSHSKTANPSKTTKPVKKNNSPKVTKSTKPTKPTKLTKPIQLTKPTKISQPTKSSQNTKSDRSKKQKLSKRPSISRRPCTRSAAKIKTKPGKLKMKRRMDADEKSASGTKKPKVDPKLSGNTADGVHLKRQLDVSGQADLGSNPQEIELTQPSASEQEDSEKDPAPKRPSKLSPRRRSSNQPTAPTVNPLQGASSATSSKFANLMQFIPTPGFRPPRKKN
ncbi:hypothetical protein Ahy_B08g093516 [Arachis hypogaea]|uniref:PB1-like domain-containing protein n=1 Tax=Arachis hypogaea TaxID=3818 RepID=A0A444Y6E6_ARAHY|nr:hypothetical protein Ahy_B08g093516 [Arachis hypogaea]